MSELPQLPPHSLEAEQSVLGAVLLDTHALAKAVELVGVEDFYRTAHQQVYRAMLDLSKVGDVIDQLTLTARLKVTGELQAVGGSAYIAELWGNVASAANVGAHARIIKDAAIRRRTIAIAQRMQAAAYDDAPLSELAHHAKMFRLPLVADAPSHDAPRGIGTFSPISAPQLFNEPDPVQPTWVWEDFLAAGGLAALVAKPKVGKTTNAYELAVKVAQGLPYLGRATRRGPVLIVAMEEHRREVKQRLRNLGADQLEEIHVHVGPLEHSPDTFHKLTQYIGQHGILLVIFDTLNTFWSVQEENDAVGVTHAIKPILTLARESGAAVLLIHHARKSGGEFGDEIRGSGALFSLLDVALILKRHEVETQRKLTTISRYPETPGELIIELREHGHEALGDPASVGKAAKAVNVRAALTETPTSAVDLGRRAGVSRGAVYTYLDQLVAQGHAQRTGTGKKGDPYLYCNCVCVFPLRGGGVNETNCSPGSAGHEVSPPDGFVSFGGPISRGDTKRNTNTKDGFVSLGGDGGQTKRNEVEKKDLLPEKLFVEEVFHDDH